MANASEKALPTADCDTITIEVTAPKNTTRLCMFEQPRPAFELIEQAARYAKDPTGYLKETLGEAIFEESKPMLHVPAVIDKDMYGTGQHKQAFENFIAQRVLGKQHGLFFFTGVQAQLAALKSHCGRANNNRVAWHISSHLESAEEMAYDELYGLQRTLLGSDPESLPTIDEIQHVLDLPSNSRPAAIVIEVPNRTLGCRTYSYADLAVISKACRAADVKLHADGARIWEIEPYYQLTAGKSFADIAALFDSVYVSFYKGMRGATGAMLVSNDENLISEAKVWQRRAGGNAWTLMYEVIDCERGFNENIGTFRRKWDKMKTVVSEILRATTDVKNAEGVKIVSFVPEEPTCCQIHTVFQGFTAEALIKARDAVESKINVRVFERLRPKEMLDELMGAERASKSTSPVKGAVTNSNGEASKHDDQRHFMEWMLMSVTEKIETQMFVDAYVALCNELVSKDKKSSKQISKAEP